MDFKGETVVDDVPDPRSLFRTVSGRVAKCCIM